MVMITNLVMLMYVNVYLKFEMFASKVSKSFLNSLSRRPVNTLYAVRTNTTTQEPPRIEKTINSVTLLGRVGADPQKKGTDEHPVAVFSLATHTNYRYESGEFMQRTEWHRVICFKPGLRETILNYLRKGQRVHVTGKISYGEIRGEDGKPKTTTAIAADDIIFFNSQQ